MHAHEIESLPADAFRRDIDQALDRLRLTLADHELIQYRIEAPATEAPALAALGKESFFWAPSSQVLTVGIDSARTYTASGRERFQEIRAAAVRDLSRATLVDARAGGEVGTAPRVFGGFSFKDEHPAPRTVPGQVWSETFGEAHFVLPRLCYERCGASRPTLTLTLSRGELMDRNQAEPWLRKLFRLQQELAELTVGSAVASSPVEVHELPRAEWSDLVQGVLCQLDQGSASKIVVARCNEYRFERPVSVRATLDALLKHARGSTRFAFRKGPHTFIGATPERLIKRQGLEVVTEALAGTFRRASAAVAEQLLASPKEHSEHAPVLEAIVEQLGPLCTHLDYPSQPTMRELPDLLHLSTPIQGVLRAPLHVLELVERLHPTPAVGGVPREAAVAWITQHEPTERGWYSGPIGWFDAQGDGEFSVALRSGLLSHDRAYLYVGAGIVRGSEPSSEHAETELKLRALYGALRFE